MAKRGNALRVTRQLVLLLVAIMLVTGTLMSRARVTSWEETLWVGIYPIAYDDTTATTEYLNQLDDDVFEDITEFAEAEAKRYQLGLERPFRIDLGSRVSSLPPVPPARPNPLTVIAWSLRLRWWAWRAMAEQNGPEPDIRLFVIFHDPETETALPHSLGLKEGRIGIAHVFAAPRMEGSNSMVIAHEMMHTVGATDKYDRANNLPLFPDGYAEPLRSPPLPQRFAELMAGRRPVDTQTAEIPRSLRQVRIGPVTAAELRWMSVTENP